jgi:hypothetical protein
MSRKYYYEGKELPPEIFDLDFGYYSLTSHKQVKGQQHGNHKSLDVSSLLSSNDGERGPYIYGSSEQIKLFLLENKTGLTYLDSAGHAKNHSECHDKFLSSFKLSSEPFMIPESILGEKKLKIPNISFASAASSFEEPSCFKNNKDVESVDSSSLVVFNYEGMRGKGKVISIINSKSINLLVYVDLIFLSRKTKILPQTTECDGYFAILNVKVASVDKLYENEIVYYRMSYTKMLNIQ